MIKQSLSILALTAVFSMANPAHAVFIGDGSGGLYDLDVDTNTSTFLGNGGVTMFDIALDPISGILYGVSGGAILYSINTTNGSVSAIGNTAGVNGLTFDSSGTLYGSSGGGTLFTINTLSGAASAVGGMGFGSAGDIAFDSSGNLFLSAVGNTLVSLNTTTGAGTAIGALGDLGFNNVFGLNFSGGTMYGFTSAGQTITIDTTTGVGTFLATNTIAAFGADGVGGVTVPEPSTLALLALGLLGFGLRRRERGRAWTACHSL